MSYERPAEVGALADALASARQMAQETRDARVFAIKYLNILAGPVDNLFDKVLVDDPNEPARRSAIKGMLHEIFVLFADRLGDLRKLGSGARPPRE
jgi:glycyl-tRNA synthetase beta subunit